VSRARWMIYGANGYTGRLIAAEAVQRGLRPVLAGRDASSVQALAEQLGLEFDVFDLQRPAGVAHAIRECRLVLHCAGPFSATSQPMVSACLAEGVHYLDITGEIPVFDNAFRQSEQARRADIVLAPGVGFDVVPSDCLAASLVRVLPAATQLLLAFEAGGGLSPGTARTSIEGLGRGGMVRVDGQLTAVPLAYKTRKIPFAHAERTAMTIPWGDVYTAFVSTGVGNIEVYLSVPEATIRRIRHLRWLRPLLTRPWMQNFLKQRVDRSIRGPDDQRRKNTACQLWGEARSADGRSVSATMRTPNGYDLTVTASLGIVEYLLANAVEGGFYTPSLLMGPDYAASLPGVTLQVGAVIGKS
jgi:short subunit dehydrogenase-like uncharacterized protein